METKHYSSVAIQFWRRDPEKEYREINSGYKIYEFDEEQTEVIRQILELVNAGDYHLINDIVDEHIVLPF